MVSTGTFRDSYYLYLYISTNPMTPAKTTIPHWAQQDRPREKLLEKGAGALSDSEIIAILLRSGNHSTSAVDLARHILASVNDKLPALSRMTVDDLLKFKGVGRAKAVTIVAALELGRRRRLQKQDGQGSVTCSKDAYRCLAPLLEDLGHEEFWIILLNRAHKVLAKLPVSKGGITGTVADPRIIFRLALEQSASSMILCHNHPSGNLKPSESDIALTHKMKQAGITLEVNVIDHLIIGGDGYYSFADEGIL